MVMSHQEHNIRSDKTDQGDSKLGQNGGLSKETWPEWAQETQDNFNPHYSLSVILSLDQGYTIIMALLQLWNSHQTPDSNNQV